MLAFGLKNIITRGLFGTLDIFNFTAILGPKIGHFLTKNAIFDDFWALGLAAIGITVLVYIQNVLNFEKIIN